MAVSDITTLKALFETGDRPSQSDFGSVFDTMYHGVQDIVRDQGAAGDGTTDDRAAIAAADTAGTEPVLFPVGTFLVSSNLIIASDCIFHPGSIIKVPTGVTITFTGALAAGAWQIFSLAGTAAIDLSGAMVDAVNPIWFGAAGDGRRGTGSITDTDKTLTIAAAPFLTTDVGKPAYVLGAGASVGTITNAEDDGGGEIKITVVGHTLKNGGVFTVKDVVGTTEANDDWQIKIPLARITNAVDNGSGLIRLTITGHPYSTGEKVTIFDVLKAGPALHEAEGDWTATKIDADTIDLQASTFTNAYVAGGFAKLTDKITLRNSAFSNAYTSGGTIHGVLSTTIASVTSTSIVELTAAAGATVDGVSGVSNVLFGTDSSAAFTAALASAGSDGGEVVAPATMANRGYICGDIIFTDKEPFRFEIDGTVYIKPGASSFLEINSDTARPRWCRFVFQEIDGIHSQSNGIDVESLAYGHFNISHAISCNICMDISVTGTTNTNDSFVDWQIAEFSNILVRITPGTNAAPLGILENWQFRIGLFANAQIGFYKPGNDIGSTRFTQINGAVDLCRLDNPGGALLNAQGIVDESDPGRSIYMMTFGGSFVGPNIRGQGLATSIIWWGDTGRWVWGKDTIQDWTDGVGNVIGEFRSDATVDFGQMVIGDDSFAWQSTAPATTARVRFSDGFAAFGGAGFTAAIGAKRASAVVGVLDRETDDGLVLDIRRDNVSQGGVQVSSGTVSILAATMAHWSQSAEIDADTPIGTIVSATENLCEWWAAKWTDREMDGKGNITEYGRHEVITHAGTMNQEKRDQFPAEAEVVKEDNDTLTKCRITTTAKDPTVMGVHKFYDEDGDVTVAGSGHFMVRVGGGKIVLGDLICSSDTPGVGMNQGDDTPRSYTVAKSRGSYDPAKDGAEKTIPCTLICG